MDKDTLLKVLEKIQEQIEIHSWADERLGLVIAEDVVKQLLSEIKYCSQCKFVDQGCIIFNPETTVACDDEFELKE